jgi:cyclase
MMVACRLLACLLLSTPTPLQAARPPKPYDVVQLADGVYGFVWRDPLQDPIEGNALLVINDRDVLVVDTGLLPSSARRMAAEVRRLTKKPVRYVVNTHWHDDHHNGNQVYRELWPGVEFIAHRNTRADAFAHTYDVRAEDLANMEQAGEKFARWAATGKDDDGKPLDEPRRRRAAALADMYRATLPEMRSLRNTPPELTVTDELVLHRGERRIEIRWLGRGNTRGDLVVFLPKERIAATGDLLVHPIPFGIGSYYADWIGTLGRVDSLDATILFPGHGAVQRDRTYLHQVQGLLRALVDSAKAVVAAGGTVEEAQRRITLPDWKRTLAGHDPIRQRAFDGFFIAPAVERAWRQARGEPDDETAPTDR